MRDFRVVIGDCNVGAHGAGFSALFGLQQGGLISLNYNGQEMLRFMPRLTFWRAPTDNDNGAGFGFGRGVWKLASLYQQVNDVKYVRNNDSLDIEYLFDLPTNPSSKALVKYNVSSDGAIRITATYYGIAGLPGFPLFGMNFPLVTSYTNFRFHGNGPEENYIDRNHGAKYGVYEGTAEGNLSRYLNPQECGNITGVNVLEVFDGEGNGIRFSADSPFEGGVLPYNEHELENAPSRGHLPKPSATWVRILAAQMGVGGDDSWGAPIHGEYMLSAEKDLHLKFTLENLCV